MISSTNYAWLAIYVIPNTLYYRQIKQVLRVLDDTLQTFDDCNIGSFYFKNDCFL